MEKILIIHDIRSNYNVGAMLRTADGAGVSKVYLSGTTPSPRDRFGRMVGEIHKTALGAEQSVDWEYVSDIYPVLAELKKSGFRVVAVEQAENSVPLFDFKVPDKVAYVMGSETEGLSKELLGMVDVIVEIPMLGQKESLNVSVAAGIVMYYR